MVCWSLTWGGHSNPKGSNKYRTTIDEADEEEEVQFSMRLLLQHHGQNPDSSILRHKPPQTDNRSMSLTDWSYTGPLLLGDGEGGWQLPFKSVLQSNPPGLHCVPQWSISAQSISQLINNSNYLNYLKSSDAGLENLWRSRLNPSATTWPLHLKQLLETSGHDVTSPVIGQFIKNSEGEDLCCL